MVTLTSSVEMEENDTGRSTWFYMETEDVYGSEEPSDLEKAIEAHAAELAPQLEDGSVETQQSATSEHLHSDDEDMEDAVDFGENKEAMPPLGCWSKDASEAGTTCGSSDETETLPYVGMKFVDLKAAYSFYTNYARIKGFGVRIDRTHLSRKREPDGSRQVLSKRFVCYKEGFRNDNDKRQKGKEVRHRTEVRVGCPAFIVVKATSDGWMVDKFEANHNHPMVFPGQTIKLLYFGEENDLLANSDSASKDTSEAGTSTGQTDVKELLPHIGMKFDDLKAAYSFYSNYARMIGFGVRIDRTNLSRKREPDGSRQVLSKRFVCYKEGFRNDNHKRYRGKEVRHRAEVRIGCPAFIVVKAASDGWVIDKFEPNHNHPMVFPGQTFRLRSPEHLMDKSYIRRNERKMIAEDCQAVLTYFDSMQVKDPRFIYSIRVSDDGIVSGIFWADSKARSAYEVFGDVVVFDVTYKTNRYKWPFGLFTGVSHNAQSVLFGCGLIANETKESFEWLFKAWMNAMGDKTPQAIITDECTGIIPAVGSVFPHTVHRFCSHNFSKQAQEHLGALWCQYPDFKNDWKECIYRSWTKEDFLARWEAMMMKYNLKNHSWLSGKFAEEYWVPCYLRGSFFAGLSSTRGSEGMDSYFRGYFKDTISLCRFVKQYERAVTRHREKEADAEFQSFSQLTQLSSQSPLEEHAAKVYTKRVFEIFKKHFNASLSLSAHEELAEGSVRKFKVGPFKVPLEQRCMVEYNSLEEEVRCSCHMFEFMGLVCKHVLKVLQMIDRDNIPSKCILFRWTKEARPELPVVNIPDVALSSITSSSVSGLSHAIRNMMAVACSSPECCEVATGTLQGLIEKLGNMVQNATEVGVSDSSVSIQNATLESMPATHKQLNTPLLSVDPGMPSQVHLKHPMEQSIEKGKSRCSICRGIGHNKTTCEAVNREAGEPGLQSSLAMDKELSETCQSFIRF